MLFFILCSCIALFPSEALSGAQNGLALCINAVIPSLLPFMLLSACLIKSEFSRPMGFVLSKLLSPFLKISPAGCVCFVTGLIGGYGAGARAVKECFEKKMINLDEAERLLAFSNNAGPLFIIGTVGIGFLGNKKDGVVLFIILLVTTLCCAAIFSGKEKKNNYSFKEEWNYYIKNKPPAESLFTEAALSSGGAIISVCVFVISFSAIIEVIPAFRIPVIAGIIEVTKGCAEISRAFSQPLPLLCAALSWGGLSVHFQANALCGGSFSMKKYYLGKITSMVISYALAKAFYSDLYIALLVLVAFIAFYLSFIAVRKIISLKLPLQRGFRQRRHS